MAIATAATGIATSAASFFEGQSKERAAKEAMRKFKFNELSNPYNRTAVSTLGSDIQKEQASSATAASVDALQASGTRGVLGGVGQVQAANQQLNKGIAADLDQQQKHLDLASAGQDVRNQELVQQQQAAELAGYGQQMNIGGQQKFQGLNQLTNTFGFASQQGFGKKIDAWAEGLFSKEK